LDEKAGLNISAYVQNNPFKYIDYYGLQGTCTNYLNCAVNNFLFTNEQLGFTGRYLARLPFSLSVPAATGIPGVLGYAYSSYQAGELAEVVVPLGYAGYNTVIVGGGTALGLVIAQTATVAIASTAALEVGIGIGSLINCLF
jgi:hypothetical protein